MNSLSLLPHHREMLQKKAEAERLERERVLEEEKRAAAAATLDELEQWKGRFAALEKAFEEEKELRVMAEEKVESLSSQAEEKDKKLREEAINAAEAKEQAKR